MKDGKRRVGVAQGLGIEFRDIIAKGPGKPVSPLPKALKPRAFLGLGFRV